MRTRFLLSAPFAAALSVLSPFAIAGCSDVSKDCEANLSCAAYDGGQGAGGSDGSAASGGAAGSSGTDGSGGSGGSAGAAATGGSGGDGGGCDAGRSPEEAPCVVANAYGVFVSASEGDDLGGDGSREKPFATVSKGLSEAKRVGKRLYACADGGNYAETLNIGTMLDGLELFGGFRCADWSYDLALRATIVSPDPVAARIEGLASGLRLENFEVRAANATQPGASSFAAIIANSQKIVFRRVKLVAGNGANGAIGQDGRQGSNGTPPGANQVGKAAQCGLTEPVPKPGGRWDADACGSRGGAGGDANQNSAGDNGVPGTPLMNVTPPNTDNKGAGSGVPPTPGTSGTQGSDGNAGPTGVAAVQRGAFTATGFTPANGNDGTNGFPGQGGGGGGASAATGLAVCIGASGGAGGMGGCGGVKGTAGSGGGASVALLSSSSGVTLDLCELVAASGGAGGKGGNGGGGGLGGSGANGGDPTPGVGRAGRGGDGGTGGPGGSGSGGTGGPSYALVHTGAPPIEMGSNMFTPGAPGEAGKGGSLQPSGVNPAANGTVGASAPKFAQP